MKSKEKMKWNYGWPLASLRSLRTHSINSSILSLASHAQPRKKENWVAFVWLYWFHFSFLFENGVGSSLSWASCRGPAAPAITHSIQLHSTPHQSTHTPTNSYFSLAFHAQPRKEELLSWLRELMGLVQLARFLFWLVACGLRRL